MADTEMPNRKSNMEKAEGDRTSDTQNEDTGGGGISNRPGEEETRNQERVPDRGETKPGAHAG